MAGSCYLLGVLKTKKENHKFENYQPTGEIWNFSAIPFRRIDPLRCWLGVSIREKGEGSSRTGKTCVHGVFVSLDYAKGGYHHFSNLEVAYFFATFSDHAGRCPGDVDPGVQWGSIRRARYTCSLRAGREFRMHRLSSIRRQKSECGHRAQTVQGGAL